MGLINYKDIDFNKSINKELKLFDFNGSEITVVPYLSISDKYDFVMITLQKSYEKGIYNLVKIDMYYDLHLVYMYTNIQVDNEDRANEADLYDIFTRSGLIEKIKENIPSEELQELKNYIENIRKILMQYQNTFGAAFGAFIEMLPENMAKAKEIIDNLDPEKYKDFMGLAKELKGLGFENE